MSEESERWDRFKQADKPIDYKALYETQANIARLSKDELIAANAKITELGVLVDLWSATAKRESHIGLLAARALLKEYWGDCSDDQVMERCKDVYVYVNDCGEGVPIHCILKNLSAIADKG